MHHWCIATNNQMTYINYLLFSALPLRLYLSWLYSDYVVLKLDIYVSLFLDYLVFTDQYVCYKY